MYRIIFLISSSLAMLCAALQVGEFASKAFVQRALRSPNTPSAVISFFYGIDYFGESLEKNNAIQELRDGSCIGPMSSLWYGGGPEYDELCSPFGSLVRQAGRGELVDEPWQSTVDGVIAQLVLCDQLSRNIFRGTSEAFAYDQASLQHARTLTATMLGGTLAGAAAAPTLTGEVYPPFLASTVTALMHSEQVQDHENALSLVEYAQESTPESLTDFWKQVRSFEEEHKNVVDRFGRYPHRNLAKGRESTAEEEAWLADVENLPGWALSQLPQKAE